MLESRRFVSAILCLVFGVSLTGAGPSTRKVSAVAMPPNRHAAYTFSLPDGRAVDVFRNGIVSVRSKDKRTAYTRIMPVPGGDTPMKQDVLRSVMRPQRAFFPNRVVVVFRSGVSGADRFSVDAKQLKAMRKSYAQKQNAAIPQYTNDAASNAILARAGADSMERLFAGSSRGTLSGMHVRAQQVFHSARLLDIANAYRVHITNGSPRDVVAKLKKLPGVAYASVDWTVATMDTGPRPMSVTETAHMKADALAVHTLSTATNASSTQPILPTNYAVVSSEQSLLNATNTNTITAFDEIERNFGQMPGQGEIITNVSLGDLDGTDALSNTSDPCNGAVQAFGPSTIVSGGQRYIDWPSMPLIPTYTADNSGNLNGMGEVCDVDPALGEIGLDFSMMAPLPHNAQRSGRLGQGPTDLLGIAPGASYRLVVPASSAPDFTDIDGALLGAARQTPHPDVITASLGLGVDVVGFPGRFLEDDPLSESVIASIVAQYDTVVCISANDGLRLFTNSAFGPSGGSAPTNTVAVAGAASDVNDIAFSNAPSLDYDSGSIAVGGVTLDDVFAVQPQNSANAAAQSQHEYAETRYDGFTVFSSGFGTRVNIAAPSDNVVALFHNVGFSDPTAVGVGLEGGTSASAPEVAAAAAVVKQVARLTGQSMSALQVRDFLVKTGDQIAPVPESDQPLLMGTALNLGHAVETLLTQAGKHVAPAVPRVAIEQRRRDGDPNVLSSLLNGAFDTATNPAAIDMTGPLSTLDDTETGANQEAWITIAPDWEGLPSDTTFKLYVTGHPAQTLATTPSARLLPAQILQVAGLPFVSSSSRTVSLTYVAKPGSGSHTQSLFRAESTRSFTLPTAGRTLSVQFSLTFGPTPKTHRDALAPIVPPVVTGSTIPVSYDLTNVASVSNPVLVVTEPGRPTGPEFGSFFHPSYSVALSALKGTVNVPVSRLQGGGVYGVAIHYGNAQGANTLNGHFGQIFPLYTDIAFTRVQTASGITPPPPPLLSSNVITPGHFLEIPYGGSFTVSYDVSSVPGATGAAIEISSGGYTPSGSLAPFNNPNGTIRDNNGMDSGSLYYVPASGTKGQITINGATAHLYPALFESVRVIPLAGSSAAGESSGASTITMDGIVPADGGFINLGYGVNQSGSDGFITSNQETAGGEVLASLESFDQSAQAITNPGGDLTNGIIMETYGWGIWGNDTGLVEQASNATGDPYLNFLYNASTGFPTGLWSPQIPTGTQSLRILAAAPNGTTTTAAFYGQITCGIFGPCGDYELFSSDLSQNSTGPLFDIQAPIQNFAAGYYLLFGQNHTTNTALLTAADAFNGAQPPLIVSVDLGTGQMNSFETLGGDNQAAGFAVDSSTNKAFLSIEDSSFGIYNLATKTGTRYMLPLGSFGTFSEGGADIGNVYNSGYNATADEVHQLFAVAQVLPPDILTNNNALSRVYIYDENGNLQETISGFALYTFESFSGIGSPQAYMQLNPSRRQGYIFGPFTQQLVPFKY